VLESAFERNNVPAWSGNSLAWVDEGTRSLYAIVAELGDYSRRLAEDGTSTLSQMAHATSVPDALGALGAFNKRTGEEYAQHVSRLASMFAEAASQQTLALQSLFSMASRVA